jgi:hypothetical protein
MANILIYIDDQFSLPVSSADVYFYANLSSSPLFSTTTDGTGHANVPVDPGTYIVNIVVGHDTYNIGNYTVKGIIPSYFSGIEMLTGQPSATSGPFQPKRFQNTRVINFGSIGKTQQLVQKANWRI